MNYLTHLKRNRHHYSSRWIVKTDNKTGLIKEVKLIYSPEEYRKSSRSKTLNTQEGLIKILEADKLKRSHYN